MEFVKLPPFYACDFLFIRDGRWWSWVEIKCRSNARLAYPDYIISLSKVMSLKQLAAETGVPARLAVGWTDAIGVLPLTTPYRLGLNRADRGKAGDRDPVCHYPIDAFHTVTVADQEYTS